MVKFTVNEARCKGCGLCVSACPKGLLRLSEKHRNEKGYHPVTITHGESCIACGSCFRICPDTAITIEKG